MEYKSYIEQVLNTYKGIPLGEDISIPIFSKRELQGSLVPVRNTNYAPLIKRWREENPEGFANRFEGTIEKTENWINNVLLPRKDRILFMVLTLDGTPVGHLGYSSFDFEVQSAEIDNVVRGQKQARKGIMSMAMKTVLAWGKSRLLLNDIFLRVLSDNPHAVTFYERLGFKEIDRIPLFRVEHHDMIEWLPLDESEERRPEKYYIVMKLCQ
jgi:RimJ/RimL family protein N-acetyltransferase